MRLRCDREIVKMQSLEQNQVNKSDVFGRERILRPSIALPIDMVRVQVSCDLSFGAVAVREKLLLVVK